MQIDWWLLTLTSPYTYFFPLDFGPFNTALTKSVNTVRLNTTFNLSCSAQANPPPSYRFYRGQESLGNISVGNTFATSVVERTRKVNYSCTPFNHFGDGQTVMIQVEVSCKYSSYFFFVCLSVLTYVTNSFGRFLDKKLFIYGKSLIPSGLFVFYCLGLPTFLIRSLSFKLLNVKSGRWREKRHRRLWNIGDKAIKSEPPGGNSSTVRIF